MGGAGILAITYITYVTRIDTLLDQVTDILHTVARNHVPPKRYRPFVKPGWTPELKQHHSKSKKLYKEWVRAGRPRSYLNQKRKRYKDAKATFRALLRKHQRDQRDIFFRSLDLEVNDTGRLFRLVWSLISVKIRSSSYDDCHRFWSSVFDCRQHADFNAVLSFQFFRCVLTTELHLVVSIQVLPAH